MDNNLVSSMDKAYDLASEEIKKLCKKDAMSPEEYGRLGCSVKMIKDIEEIRSSSLNPMPSDRMSYSGSSYGMPYDRYTSMQGQSYGPHMMARYSSERRSGHSIKDRMVDRLESMMDEAQTDYERQTIAEWVHRLRMSE